MKVLVIGGCGSIGRRYVSILEFLGVPYQILDPLNTLRHNAILSDFSFDRAIIASPTETHYPYCVRLLEKGIPFLCEKPVSRDMKELDKLKGITGTAPFYVVNNYAYVVNKFAGQDKARLTYDYYRTGQDGLWWDVVQLLVLDPDAVIRDKSPIWNFYVNDALIPYRELEVAYIHMINDFLKDNSYRLWTLEHGVKMTELALERIKTCAC